MTNKQPNDLLTRGVDEIIIREHLEDRLQKGEKIRVKLGIDPTGPHLHIGHAVQLLKLRQFQRLGHKIVLIIGDFTARIGDPTGKSAARKQLTAEDVQTNLRTYLAQVQKIIDPTTIEVRYNNEWFGKMTALDFMRLMSHFTVQRVLERDDFQKRMKADQDVSANEMVYPVLQGYDSVMIDADIEIGGTDQKFNMLFGRRVQRQLDKPEQDVMTLKLLTDPTGKKMGKTEGNMVMLEDKPEDMYGKIMTWPDTMIAIGLELCTEVPMDEVRAIAAEMSDDKLNPRDAKMRLAREVVSLYCGSDAAAAAEAHFVKTIQKGEMPENIPTVATVFDPCDLITVLVDAHLASSRSDARRLIAQHGVRVNDQRVQTENSKMTFDVPVGAVIRVGRRAVRLVNK